MITAIVALATIAAASAAITWRAFHHLEVLLAENRRLTAALLAAADRPHAARTLAAPTPKAKAEPDDTRPAPLIGA